MKNLVYMLDEIGLGAADVTKRCIAARAAISDGQSDMAKKEIANTVRTVRHLVVLTNIIRDVLDAMEVNPIADGDLEATKEAVGA